jgi:hypothetical protein
MVPNAPAIAAAVVLVLILAAVGILKLNASVSA